MNDRRLILIVHDVRSAHNVGSILRSADGLGIERVYLTGYTPYPRTRGDHRLPHVVERAEKQISKTAIGAEKSVDWRHGKDAIKLIRRLKEDGFMAVALEQTDEAVGLPAFHSDRNIVLVVGSEIGGIPAKLLKTADAHLSIPMQGVKESFNVAVAASIALYHLRWYNHKPDDRQNKNSIQKIRP